MIYELDPKAWLIIGKFKGTTFEAIVFHRLHNGSPFPGADIIYISEHIKYISEGDLEYSKRLLKEVMMEHYTHV